MFKNLKFFGKDGKLLNFIYNSSEDKWTGNLYFGIVSEGLIENKAIHILETVYLNDALKAYPQKFVVDDGDDNVLNISLENDKVDQFFMYDFKAEEIDDKKFNFIDKKLQYQIELDKFDITISDGYKRINSLIDPINGIYKALLTSPVSINIAFQPTCEEIYENKLFIKIGDHIIAEIYLHGEGEEEDERLRDMLINLGYDLLPEDIKIFSESDIKEDSINWGLVNRKRKELLLEHSNLYPYLGSYKALANVLKFFGYKNTRLKEYWKNVDVKSPNYNKLWPVEIGDLFLDSSEPYKSDVLLNNKVYKKTGKISLHYDIIVESGEFDDEGLPLTKEVYEFSPEEILIKLYALKKKLQTSFLPIGSKIIDIIGEAVFFGVYDVGLSTSYNKTDIIKADKDPKFDIVNTENVFYIEDLRYLGNIRKDGVLNIEQINQVLNYKKINKPDDENITVGFPLILKNNTFDLTFQNLRYEFNQLLNTQDYTNWDNIDRLNIAELIWKIEYNTTENSDKYFLFERTESLINSLSYDNLFGIVLPYTGTYNITLSIKDLYNFTFTKTKQSIIEVHSYESDFISWYKKAEKNQTFDNIFIEERQSDFKTTEPVELNWLNYGSTWDNPIYPNEPVSIGEFSYECLNSANFYQSLKYPIENKNIGYFDYAFNSLENETKWKDLSYLDWVTAGSRPVQWRISDFIDISSDYHYIEIGFNQDKSTCVFESELITKLNYLELLEKLKNTTGVFTKFLYFLVEKQDTFDIFAITKNKYESFNRYNINYKASISGEYSAQNLKPYLVDYIDFIGDTPGHFEIYDVIEGEDIIIEILDLLNYKGFDYSDGYSTGYSLEFPEAGNGSEYSIDYSLGDDLSQDIRYSHDSAAIYRAGGFSTLEEFYLDLIDPLNEEAKLKLGDFYIEPTYKIVGEEKILIKIQFIQKNKIFKSTFIINCKGVYYSSYIPNMFNNINYSEIRVLKYSEKLPLLTNVHLSYNNSKIPGKQNPLWVISKPDDIEFDDIYYRNKFLSYTFTQRGNYTISLYLEDSNGNSKIKTKQEFIKII